MAAWNPFDHHRGPYLFCVLRAAPTATKPWRHTSEWLSGHVEREDVPSEARALLEDKRDSIVSVFVWSETEQQHVTTYTRRTTC
jgi:hypothetical protein